MIHELVLSICLITIVSMFIYPSLSLLSSQMSSLGLDIMKVRDCKEEKEEGDLIFDKVNF